MSRIGKRPIPVADGVQVQYTDREFSVKGPKGEMKMRIHEDVELQVEEGVIQLAPNASRGITPMLGTTWALVRNMLMGVSNGFVKCFIGARSIGGDMTPPAAMLSKRWMFWRYLGCFPIYDFAICSCRVP